jgi:hypothetical protein
MRIRWLKTYMVKHEDFSQWDFGFKFYLMETWDYIVNIEFHLGWYYVSIQTMRRNISEQKS